MAPADAERHRPAGWKLSERERTNQTPYNFSPRKKILKKVLRCQTRLIKESATGDISH